MNYYPFLNINTMKPLNPILINSLHSLMSVVADLCDLLMSRLGLIKWAYNNNLNNFNVTGTLGNMIFYNRCGKACVRMRPSHYNIKEPSLRQSGWSRFKAFYNLARRMNTDLHSLYQRAEPRRTLFNTLCSQLSQFWVKQNDGTYLFSPGTNDVSIGNGTMHYARNVVFSSPSADTLKIDFDSAVIFPGIENSYDTLQIMFIDQYGNNSSWIDLLTVTRSSGNATVLIPASFGTKIYPSVKFKAGSQLPKKIKGTFRFPQGLKPVSIIRS